MKRKPMAMVSDRSGQPTEEPLESSGYDSTPQSSLVGDVLDKAPSSSPGRVLVRWRTIDGLLNEAPLRVVRGLEVDSGDLVLLHRPSNWPEWLVINVIEGQQQADAANATPTIRGRRIEIEGADEVALRCGQASITLRRNGRVVMRGTYVESRSKGTNRIKGGTVLIN